MGAQPDFIFGEMHVHQSTAGSHPDGVFVDPAISTSLVTDDSIAAIPFPPAQTTSSCEIFTRPVCDPNCATGTYCARDGECRPLVELRYVDAGALHVAGGMHTPRIDLSFRPEGKTYLLDPPASANELIFEGGELLEPSGDGAVAPAFWGTVRAPSRMELLAPTEPHVPETNALDVKWRAATSSYVLVSLTLKGADGSFLWVRCRAADADGAFTFTSELLFGAPPRPRSFVLDVSRNNFARAVAVADPTRGVVLHVGDTAFVQGRDD